MNPEQLTPKIENLERQLPRWEKWLFVCYGVAFTFLINTIIRAIEHAYLMEAFVYTDQEIKALGPNFSFHNIPESIYDAFSKSLNAPWWTLFFWIILLAMLFPGVLLSVHSEWRIVPLSKRFNLIFGYFISAWVVFLSFGAENPNGTPDGFIFLLIGFAIAIGMGYWWLRQKKDGAEEDFP